VQVLAARELAEAARKQLAEKEAEAKTKVEEAAAMKKKEEEEEKAEAALR
jgi:hypothetical protein